MTDEAVLCPYCDGSLQFLPGDDDMTCDECGRRLNGEMVRAYKDGEAAFIDGHRNLATIQGRRIELRGDPLIQETGGYYRQAYSRLRKALAMLLPQVFRAAAIQMLADITRFMSFHGMTSHIEAGYWARLLVELDTNDQLRRMDERLAEGRLGLIERLLSWRRRRKLIRRLRQMDVQINELEQMLAYVDPPRARVRSSYLD